MTRAPRKGIRDFAVLGMQAPKEQTRVQFREGMRSGCVGSRLVA